jgi:short-subunit dehydrogenase
MSNQENRSYEFGLFLLDPAERRLLREGRPVPLAPKAFDLLLGESLWAELRPLGIDALAVSPGYTRTEFHEAAGVARPKIAGPLWSSADDVARAALAGLGRTGTVVVGLQYRVLSFLVRLVPRGLVNRLAGPVFFRKLGRIPADEGRRRGG